MKGLGSSLLELPDYEKLLAKIHSDNFPVSVIGVSGVQKSFCISNICYAENRPSIIVAQDESEAKVICDDLKYFMQDRKIMYFPAREVVFYEVDAMSRDVTAERLEVLESLIHNQNPIVVTTIESLLQKLPRPEAFKKLVFEIKLGQDIGMQEITTKFVEAGYERVDIVEGRGQFAVRGGIVDFFCFSGQYATRIEFFGDTVDSVRKFDVITQRSVEMIEKITVYPVREWIFDKGVIEALTESVRKELRQVISDSGEEDERIKRLKAIVEADIEKLAETGIITSFDKYFAYLGQPVTLLDYVSKEYLMFIDQPIRIMRRAEGIYKDFIETYKMLLEKGIVLPSSSLAINSSEETFESLKKGNYIGICALESDEYIDNTGKFSMAGREITGFLNFEILLKEIKQFLAKNKSVVLLAGNKPVAQRTTQELREREINAIYCDSYKEIETKKGMVFVTHGTVSGSFEMTDAGLVLISDNKLFGEDRKTGRMSKKKAMTDFTDLHIGDYVVHQTHGIGQYLGINKLTVEGVTRDYLKISYQKNDMLYIPSTQLESIQKYVGSEGKAPKINKFGGIDWSKTKKRVKESLMNIAEELINIYAQRETSKGYAFSEDTVWQRQFEEQFPYQETEDQLKCIEEVKADMESPKVMDRLLCGDVGFGKTEIALRAGFKAAIDGKQVVYLVPTTILAQQHFNTFARRMKDFPIKVEMLSRFKTTAQQGKIVRDMKNGNIDILIGTHRLLQKDIEFKDLGLLIIDEEQRFGVVHKEKIKKLRSNVDVLTLTATPIPRTLHMATVGIRDMSAIYDPPEDRHPVQTFVMEYDEEIIREALIREINRKGQVFYLSNRVQSIHKVASKVNALVPEAKVIIAHGQMHEKELEEIMVDFVEGKGDILVCTTIIESGLDIPNVNTIIIEDADRMGLAQLYQLRGRVGRASRLAYAYLTYKKDKSISEDAEKRLKAIKDFTEFGSGFKIAMRDLEIRGAGNLVGAEQHGHIEAVGYDTYCSLLEAAIRELKGEPEKENRDVQIDLNVSAFISDEYIKSELEKIEMYKKIASVQEQKDIEDIEDELIDRYGEIPNQVFNLIDIAEVKILARSFGINLISDKNGAVVLQFKEHGLKIELLAKLMNIYKGKLLFSAGNPPYITYRSDSKENKLKNIKNILQKLKKLQDSE